MNENELKEIEARAAAATPGPWDVGETPYFDGAIGSEFLKIADGVRVHDRPFIAHARTDIPNLLAEVRDLRAVIKRLDLIDLDFAGRYVCRICGSRNDSKYNLQHSGNCPLKGE